ncbi:hypothetical protein LCM08_00500 [Salipiger pacificus]|nr:hypothetical protein [Alloyangia pacifica]
MNPLLKRIKRIEAPARGSVVLLMLPPGIDENSIEELASDACGASGPRNEVMRLHVAGCEAPSAHSLGDMRELFALVAEKSQRIGMGVSPKLETPSDGQLPTMRRTT